MTVKQLEAWRSKLGLSQAKMAVFLGYSKGHYEKLVAGTKRITEKVDLKYIKWSEKNG